MILCVNFLNNAYIYKGIVFEKGKEHSRVVCSTRREKTQQCTIIFASNRDANQVSHYGYYIDPPPPLRVKPHHIFVDIWVMIDRLSIILNLMAERLTHGGVGKIDLAISHKLVSKIEPYICKYELF